MKSLFIIICCLFIIFFLYIFFGGENGIREKFIGLLRFDPNSEEFYDMLNEYSEEFHQNDNSNAKYTKIVDNTPDINGKYSVIKTFDNTINIDEYIPLNNKKCSKGEIITRMTLEKIYGVPFKNTRPDFLLNEETGRNLELDCYNEDLKIAAEYNGHQHYKWPNKYHDTIADFEKQVDHDNKKRKLCEMNGIHLIEVPYNIPLKNIPSFIIQNLPETFDED